VYLGSLVVRLHRATAPPDASAVPIRSVSTAGPGPHRSTLATT